VKGRTGGEAVRSSVKVPTFFERRVGGDSINTTAVDAAQEPKVVAVKQRPVFDI